MPEALAVLFMFTASALTFVFARVLIRPHTTGEEVTRLKQQLAWLEERQLHADEKRWDVEMKLRMARQIEETRQKLAEMERAPGVKS